MKDRRKRYHALGRHPSDAGRLLLAAAVFALGALIANRASVSRLEADVFRVFNDLPSWVGILALPILHAGSAAAIGIASGLALLALRIRVGVKLAVAGTLGWTTSWVVSGWIDRPPPSSFLDEVVVRGPRVLEHAYPADQVVVAAAIVAVAAPYVQPRLGRFAWWFVAVIGGAAMFAGSALPVDVIGGAALGWFEGQLLHLISGAPGRAASPDLVREALEGAGISVERIRHVRGFRWLASEYVATTEEGEELVARVVRQRPRVPKLLYKARRFLASLDPVEPLRFASPIHEVDHYAVASLVAERAGVRTPHVLLAKGLPDGSGILVRRRVDGTRLDDIVPEELEPLVRDALEQVAKLHGARVAHHDLTPDRFIVDTNGAVWLRGFEEARTSASDALLDQDVAEVLLSLSVLLPPPQVVAVARETLGTPSLEAAMRYLHNLALPTRVRRQLRGHPEVLPELRLAVSEATGAEAPRVRPRVRPTTVLSLAVIGGAIYILLPQIGSFERLLLSLRRADPGWLVVAAAVGALTFPAAAVGYMGAVRQRLPPIRTTAIQLASAFTSRLTPAGLGGLGLNALYLERQGIDRKEALGAIAINHTAGAIVHAIGVFVALGLIGAAGIGGIHVPTGWPLLVAIFALVVIGGLVVWTPFGRRRVLRPARQTGRDLLEAIRHPLRSAALFGGSAAVTMANALALVACLEAFGAEVSVAGAILVYVGGSAVAAPAPTPGNLGAVEAALVAGLTGIGVAAAPAVASVLTFRLLTFWFPILPGLAMFRYLQARRVL